MLYIHRLGEIAVYIVLLALLIFIMSKTNPEIIAYEKKITIEEISNYINGTDYEKKESKNSIINKVMKYTDKSYIYENDAGVNLYIVDGKFRKKDVLDKLFIVKDSNGNALVVLYTYTTGGYMYVSTLGSFSKIEGSIIVLENKFNRLPSF